ncbi:hypothetical protein PVAP13_8NG298300 [Panicum virgatum]|uniref:Uncharacterized protein n=1 Tax=Panicum virgatum TaxID=38727 RepID=A0A8T0PCA1_PANVG|nr:hypothetical protein PVAP13_8NG298300 [Panicum virgatum]
MGERGTGGDGEGWEDVAGGRERGRGEECSDPLPIPPTSPPGPPLPSDQSRRRRLLDRLQGQKLAVADQDPASRAHGQLLGAAASAPSTAACGAATAARGRGPPCGSRRPDPPPHVRLEPHGLLPADKVAIIVMHKIMGRLMSSKDGTGSIRFIQAAHCIGEAVECEKSRKKKDQGDNDPALGKEQAKCWKHVNNLVRRPKMSDADAGKVGVGIGGMGHRSPSEVGNSSD